MKKVATLTISVCVLGLLFAATADAANDANCNVVNVSWNNGSFGKGMMLNCNTGSDVHVAYLSGAGSSCPVTDIDTLKLWMSLAETARVSGKLLNVWYTMQTCNGVSSKYINAIEMVGN